MNEDRVFDKLDSLEEKSSQALIALARLQVTVEPLPDHEKRLRALEKWRWGLVGTTSLLTTAFTLYAGSKGVQ